MEARHGQTAMNASVTRKLLVGVSALVLAQPMFGPRTPAGQAHPDGSLGDSDHAPVGVLPGDPLNRLGVTAGDLREAGSNPKIRYLGMTRFLDKARAVVTGTLDDSSDFVPRAIDALDKYGIKATIAVSTQREPISRLWERLREAISSGHEVASHSRRHQCQWPDPESFCREAYSQDEIVGSRDDILGKTEQPYVWTWVYPCGNCADYEFVHRRLMQAGYLVARNYPDERQGGILVPDLRTWARDRYNAAFTQVVQKKGGVAPAGRTDLTDLNAKFDEVYKGEAGSGNSINKTFGGGIYHFMSHPQWLDYGPDKFYEQHLAYLGGRPDVWYVPMGPLYAYQVVSENTVVRPIKSKDGWERFAVYHSLDPAIYNNSVTLEFRVAGGGKLEARSAGAPLPERESKQLTDRWNVKYFRRAGESALVTVRPNTIVELRLID